MKMKLESVLQNKKTEIDIDPVDFFLEVGEKTYRIKADNEGNITFVLINGLDAKITTWNGYPAVKIVGR